MKKLNILNIRLDGGTQPRLELDQDMVRDYAEKMREGIKFPPIIVFHDGSEYWLADGFHRYFATKANEITTIEAEVINGTSREAMLFAWGANGKHGKQLSSEDKRHIILKMLHDPEWGKWTNAKIAEIVHVSAMTVGRVRSGLDQETKERKFIDKHGNEGTMKTTKIGKKKTEIQRPTTKPDVTTANPSQEYIDRIGELTDAVNQLADENTLLRDKIALGQWDASEIEKIDAEETIANLREQVRVLEIENKTLRESRDMYQSRNSELMKTVKSLTSKLKKLETA